MTLNRILGATLVAALLGGTAQAADLIVTEAPAEAAAASDASFYLGVIGGYGTGVVDLSDVTFDGNPAPFIPDEMDMSGYLLGVQGGVDIGVGSGILLGVVADASWTNISGSVCVESGGCDDSPDDSYLDGTIDWLATLRGKLGVDVGTMTLYGTAGFALAHTTATVNALFASDDPLRTVEADHSGWTAGVGATFDIADNVSLGLEYLYVDLGSADYEFATSGPDPVDVGGPASITANVIRASLNVHL